MVNWNKDRNRQLRKRARAEEIQEKVKEWSTRPRRNVPPPLSKSALRTIGEELVRQHKNKRRSGSDGK
jgi:hypothetical protein